MGNPHERWMVYNGDTLLKWMIWIDKKGYPYFRKPPNADETSMVFLTLW
jgi:hypothetical protein